MASGASKSSICDSMGCVSVCSICNLHICTSVQYLQKHMWYAIHMMCSLASPLMPSKVTPAWFHNKQGQRLDYPASVQTCLQIQIFEEWKMFYFPNFRLELNLFKPVNEGFRAFNYYIRFWNANHCNQWVVLLDTDVTLVHSEGAVSDCTFHGIKTADMASNVHTFSSLWEQRQTLISFPSSDSQWTYWDLQHWLVTKPKLPTTFPCARTQMDAEGHSFTHPFSKHMYTLITIMNGFWRQSITVNKMNLWTEHVFGWDRSTQLLSQAAWGTDKKGLQTKEAITLLSLCMSAFQKPLSAAKETKTMPSVLLGNWCVTFIRCLGRVWGEEGSWVGGVGGGDEGGVEGVEKGWVAKLLTPIQS